MNEQTLSKRLELVASFVPSGARLADIGTDHAYLPVSLVLRGKIDFAIASDVVKGPYESAVRQIVQSNVSDKVEARLASGLESLDGKDGITAITICGMGGALIADILDQGYAKNHLTGKERLILQPNVAGQNVRTWLTNHTYGIIAEDIIEENEKIYEVIVAQKEENPRKLDQDQLLFGPILMQEPTAAFRKKWQQEKEKNNYIIQQLKKVSVDQSAKIAELEETNKKIQELIDK